MWLWLQRMILGPHLLTPNHINPCPGHEKSDLQCVRHWLNSVWHFERLVCLGFDQKQYWTMCHPSAVVSRHPFTLIDLCSLYPNKFILSPTLIANESHPKQKLRTTKSVANGNRAALMDVEPNPIQQSSVHKSSEGYRNGWHKRKNTKLMT